MFDCNAAIVIDGSSLRAHIVRCFAHIYLSDFVQAAEDHEQAVLLAAGNRVLLERLEELRITLETLRSGAVYAAARTSSSGSSANTNLAGIASGNVDWVGDFGLLSLDFGASPSRSSDSSSASAPVVVSSVGARRRAALKSLRETGGGSALSNVENMVSNVSSSDVEEAGIPKLIPTGETLGLDICEKLLDDSRYKLAEKAQKEKLKGNAEFAKEEYARALELYSRAIKLNPEEALFYSNRALVYLKLHRYKEAVSDCSASIARYPSIKAFARRATAYGGLNLHVLAAKDHRQALSFEPRNPVCLSAYRECLEKLLAQENGVSAEDRAQAQRDLADIDTLGRVGSASEDETSESSLTSSAGAITASPPPPPPTAVTMTQGGVKRTAGGV